MNTAQFFSRFFESPLLLSIKYATRTARIYTATISFEPRFLFLFRLRLHLFPLLSQPTCVGAIRSTICPTITVSGLVRTRGNQKRTRLSLSLSPLVASPRAASAERTRSRASREESHASRRLHIPHPVPTSTNPPPLSLFLSNLSPRYYRRSRNRSTKGD